MNQSFFSPPDKVTDASWTTKSLRAESRIGRRTVHLSIPSMYSVFQEQCKNICDQCVCLFIIDDQRCFLMTSSYARNRRASCGSLVLAKRSLIASCKRWNYSWNTKFTVSKLTFFAKLECCPSEQSLRTSVHVFSVFTWKFFTFVLLFCHSKVTNRLVGAGREDLRSARLANVYKKMDEEGELNTSLTTAELVEREVAETSKRFESAPIRCGRSEAVA